MHKFTIISPDKPSAPQNLRVTEVSKDFVTLTWDTPESDGNAPITGYVIEKLDTTKTSWASAGSTDNLTFKAKRLFEGSNYLFRVAAENKIGTGEFAVLTEAVTAKLPFGETFYNIQNKFKIYKEL